MGQPIRISVLANASQAKRELGSVAGVAERTGSRLGRFGKAAGLAVAGGLGVAGYAAAKFGQAALKSASDAQQSYGATETVFGKFSQRVIKHSNRAAQGVGLSANQYRESANLIGALFKNQGVQSDVLAKKTSNMVRTGADLAATYGGTTREAVEALGSAFKGEFDPLERYGISIKQSTINAALAAKGQDKLTGAALRTAQQQATTALITKQAGGALGAFGRENDTLAGKQQRTAATAENIKAKFGSALLPAFTSLYGTLNSNVLPAVSELADKYAPRLGSSLSNLATSAGPKLAAALQGIPAFVERLRSGGGGGAELGDLSTNIGKLATGAQQASTSMPSFTDAFSVSNAVLGFAADHIGTLTKLLPVLAFGYAGLKASQLAANVVQTLSLPTKVAEVVVNRQLVQSNRALIASRAGVTTATVTNTAAENVGMLTRVRAVVSMVAQRVAMVATSAATKAMAAAQWILNAALSANPIALVVIAIAALVAGIVLAYRHSETFRAVVQAAWGAIKTATAATFNFVKNVIVTAFTVVKAVITTYVRIYVSVIRAAWNAARAVTSAVWGAIKAVVSAAIRVVATVVRSQIAVVRTVITTAWNVVRAGTTAVWNGIKTAVRVAINAVVTVVRGLHSKVSGIFSGAGSWLLNAGKKIIGGLINGIESMIGAVKAKLKSLTNLIPKVKGPPKKDAKLLQSAGRSIIQGLIDGFNDKTPDMVKVLQDTTEKIRKAFDGAREARGLAVVKSYTPALTRMGKQYEVINTRLDDATKKLEDAKKAFEDYRDSVADGVKSVYQPFTDLGDLVELGPAGFGMVLTEVLAKSAKQAGQAQVFATTITDLANRGLSQSVIDGLRAQGPELGTGIAQAIASGGATAIAQLNRDTSVVDQTAASFGKTMAAKFYTPGVSAAQGLVNGFNSQAAALTKAMTTMAGKMQSAIKKALGIRSPSRVFSGIGEDTLKGLRVGLDKQSPLVRANMRALAQDLSTYDFKPSATLTASQAYGLPNASNQTMTASVTLSAQVLSQVQRGREVQLDLNAYNNRGGQR